MRIVLDTNCLLVPIQIRRVLQCMERLAARQIHALRVQRNTRRIRRNSRSKHELCNRLQCHSDLIERSNRRTNRDFLSIQPDNTRPWWQQIRWLCNCRKRDIHRIQRFTFRGPEANWFSEARRKKDSRILGIVDRVDTLEFGHPQVIAFQKKNTYS